MENFKEKWHYLRIEKIMKTTDIKSFTDRELISTILTIEDEKIPDIKRIFSGVLSTISDKHEKTTYEDLTSNEGIGKEIALKILACYEISRRYSSGIDTTDKITKPEDCLKFLERYRHEKQEYFITISLNGAGEILGVREITKGLLNHSLVHPREVFAPAITDRAASIICAHNHPSGSLEPSSQDIAITRQLKEAGGIIGISLVDHLIVSKNGHMSMRERGLI
jgi:DNA repair protein RadC